MGLEADLRAVFRYRCDYGYRLHLITNNKTSAMKGS